MPNLTTTTNPLHELPIPTISESESATALNLARARALASEKLLVALTTDEPLPVPVLKLCLDTLKLKVDHAAAPSPPAQREQVAPELQHTLERVLRLAGDAFRSLTDPAGVTP